MTLIGIAFGWLEVVVLATLLMAGAGIALAAPRMAKSVGREFARRNQAYVDAEFVAQFDRETVRGVRRGLMLFLPPFYLFVLTSTATTALAMIAPALLAVAFAIEGAIRLHRAGREFVAASTGPAVARARNVGIADYVPAASMWCYASQAVTAILLLAGVISSIGTNGASSPLIGCLVGAGILTLLTVLSPLYWNSLVRRPQRSVDAAHLYLQDAWRSDTLRSAAIWLAVPTWFSAFRFEEIASPPTTMLVLLLVSAVLTMCCYFWASTRDLAGQPWFRKRLWPMLAPGQVLLPGEPVPAGAPR